MVRIHPTQSIVRHAFPHAGLFLSISFAVASPPISLNAIIPVISPSRVTRSTRLWCPSVTRSPPRRGSIAYCQPVGTKKSGAGGLAKENAPMSAITVALPGPSLIAADWQ